MSKIISKTLRSVVVRDTFSVQLSPTSVTRQETPAPRSVAVTLSTRDEIDEWHGSVESNNALYGSQCVRTSLHLETIERQQVHQLAADADDDEDAKLWRKAELKVCSIVAQFASTGVDVYGGGELAGALNLTGRKIVAWCSDVPFYSEHTASLYQAHAWLLLLMADGSACGVLVDTTYRCTLDATRVRDDADDDEAGQDEHVGEIRFSVALGAPELLHPAHRACWSFDVYRLFGAHPADVAQELANLTGHMPMPPRWALGYQQCRYSYYPHEKALAIATEFRQRQIPCDVLWFDIHYMHKYRIFTFDPELFPAPAVTNKALHDMGFHSVWMIDPGVGDDRERDTTELSALTTGVCASGTARDVWVKESGAAGAAPWLGDVWPGACLFPDFTSAAARQWWSEQYAPFLAQGVDGVWNDMNEPSVFNTASKTMALTAWHAGAGAPHAFVHNVYGILMAGATRDGMLAARPDRRPFVLTRAGGIGSQRVAATWTGDNCSDARHMRYSIPMVLNLGLSGQPFSGPDIGGFFGDAHPRLFARWIALGTLLPLSRAHTALDTLPHEPWAFGAECEATCRVAISRRYRLLPELYTLFYRAHQTGVPVVRPLFYAAPSDQSLRNEDSGFLIGDNLLVRTPADFFADSLLPDAERDALEAEALARRALAAQAVVDSAGTGGTLGPLSVDPQEPLRVIPPRIARDSLRDAVDSPMPGGSAKWHSLDSELHGTIDLSGARIDDLPSIWLRRGAIVPLGGVVQSTEEITAETWIDVIVVALCDEPQAMATGVVYEDDGDGYDAERWRETTFTATLLDDGAVIVRRELSNGSVRYRRLSPVRVVCFVGERTKLTTVLERGETEVLLNTA